MPDKIVRDEMLRSHRYVALSSDTAKLLFVHLLLSSDHFGNAEATTTAVNLAMGRQIDAEAQATLISELTDRDLVRPYQIDGKPYVHIPRQRQRIRYPNGKHPRPPSSIEDNQINKSLEKVRLQSAEVKGSEGKRREVPQRPLPEPPPVDKYSDRSPYARRWLLEAESRKMFASPGETEDSFFARVKRAYNADKVRSPSE